MASISATERLHDVIYSGDLDAIKQAANAPGIDVNAVIPDMADVPQTALQRVINSEIPLRDGSRLAIVKFFVQRCGADINKTGGNGSTALMTAVTMLMHENDRLSKIPKLSRTGGDWLEFLMAEQIVKFLYENGANPDAKDNVLGRSPRSFANEQRLVDVQEMFKLTPEEVRKWHVTTNDMEQKFNFHAAKA